MNTQKTPYQILGEEGIRQLTTGLFSIRVKSSHMRLAHVEERSKQELSVGMGTVLRIGPDRIVTLDGYS